MIITYLLPHVKFPQPALSSLGLLFLLMCEVPIIQGGFTFSQLFYF